MRNLLNDFLHLFFPHNCLGCGTDVLDNKHQLCARCFTALPETGFIPAAGNPVEKIFYGRIDVLLAGAAYYFTKQSALQNTIFSLKYKSNQEAGIYLGKLLGNKIKESKRFEDVDVLVPLPLNNKKQFKRGYNQAEVICKGIAEVWKKPINTDVVLRSINTKTQTHKNRVARWQSMQGVFDVNNVKELEGKHILLVDDVVTTGATLEACGDMLLSNIPGIKLSIATVAVTAFE